MAKKLVTSTILNRFRADLMDLNNARRGSFGESVFAESVRRFLGLHVERLNRKQCDFLVEKWGRVDVKTSFRRIETEEIGLSRYNGKRLRNTRYACVELYKNGARVSVESQVVKDLTWPQLYDLWQKRSSNRRDEASPSAKSVTDNSWLVIKQDIERFFKRRRRKARAIERTTQDQFGNRGPLNLWPVDDEDLVVFVDYYDASYTGIRKVYAVPARHANKIPRIPWSRGRQVSDARTPDLYRVPARFTFESVWGLKRHYFKRFP